MGAQSFLYAGMEERYSRVGGSEGGAKGGEGAFMIKECAERPFGRDDVNDEDAQKRLWEYSEKMVVEAEKRGAQWRAKEKKEAEERKDEEVAEKEVQDYKEKIGKKEGVKQEGSRRIKKAG